MIRTVCVTALTLGLTTLGTLACTSTESANTADSDPATLDTSIATEEESDAEATAEVENSEDTAESSTVSAKQVAKAAAKKSADQGKQVGAQAKSISETVVIDEELSEADDAEAEDAESSEAEDQEADDQDQGEAVEESESSAEVIFLPCDLPVLGKSPSAVAQPCLTTDDFIRSLDLSADQIRRVKTLSGSIGIAH